MAHPLDDDEGEPHDLLNTCSARIDSPFTSTIVPMIWLFIYQIYLVILMSITALIACGALAREVIAI